MENRCDFDSQRINFWNNTYNLIKHLSYKVYVNFDWATFKDRKFPVIGAVHIDNLAMLKKSLLDNQIFITNILTPHYRGVYFESSPECAGLFIALTKETDTFKQDFGELRDFGREHNIDGLALIDELSKSLLLTNIGFLLYDMAGIYNQDFREIQSVNDIDPSKIFFWYKICGVIKTAETSVNNFKVIIDPYWKTFQDRKFPVIGTVHIDDLKVLKKSLSDNHLLVSDLRTRHYRGIYFESSPECAGLFIAPIKETDTFKQNLGELRAFGMENNIESLYLMDELSEEILLNNIEYMLNSMAGISHKDFIEIQSGNACFNPLKTAFWCDIYSLIKRNKYSVYLDFDWQTFKKRKLPVVGSIKTSDIELLRNRLEEFKFETNVIKTLNYSILYFESDSDLSGLFLSFKDEAADMDLRIIDSDLEFTILSELRNAGRKHRLENLFNLDFLSSSLIKRCLEQNIAEILGIPLDEIRVITYKNSHLEYIRNYLDYKNKRKDPRHDISHKSNKTLEENINFFSAVYYLEIELISEILKGQSVSMHDVGTNVAQFPLLLSALSCEELFGLEISRIIASDIAWTGEGYIKNILKDNERYRPISFIKLDLMNEIQNSPVADVVIANDVLEHLPDEEASFSVLSGLWEKTGKLMIAHVPIEDTPNPLWDHHVTFNEKKIRNWVNRLPGTSKRYYSGKKQTLTRYGFFIVSKI